MRSASSAGRACTGYAGWGPASSEKLAEGSWIVEPALPDDVFTDDPEGLWSEVLRRKERPVRGAGRDAAGSSLN
jgi:putative transcriptional regulator